MYTSMLLADFNLADCFAITKSPNVPDKHQNTPVSTTFTFTCAGLRSFQVLEPAVRTVVNNFVSERNTSEVMAVG